MASRRGDTFEKRQRERRRQEKAAGKRARRQGQEPAGPVTNSGPKPPPTTPNSEAMEKFRVLSEHHAAGGIDDDLFQIMRAELFEEMGLEVPE